MLEFQKNNGGFSFKSEKLIGRTNSTFWTVFTLESYSWLMDYNPVGIYSFINTNIKEILNNNANRTLIKLMEMSKLVIMLSIIWKKFIEEIERVLFKQIEKEKYISLDQIKANFGLVHGIEDVLSYINRNYTFHLKILDNRIEFNNYTRNLSLGKKAIVSEIYSSLSKNSVVSISDIYNKHKSKYISESLDLKEHIIPIINDLVKKDFFKGKIEKKGKLRKNFVFYLDNFLFFVIVSDTEIDIDKIIAEKEKLKDHRNTMYNMILKLKEASQKTKEEVESYLLINEIDIAKERIKYLIHNTLMDAEFLNENIEQSFNEELYYINLQEALSPEINRWKRNYSQLGNRLKDIELNLQSKIEEKEGLRNFSKLLDELEARIFNISNEINKDLDAFRNIFREHIEKTYTEEKFNILIQEFDKIAQKVSKYDNAVFKISQKINTKEEKLKQKHKKIIDTWVGIKTEFDSVFNYYLNGFNYFRNNIKTIEEIKNKINSEITKINQKSQEKVKENRFQEAFNVIKTESDTLLSSTTKQIKSLQEEVKSEIKSKQKLFLLYRHLQEELDKLEEYVISLVAEQGQSLKNKIIEERNRAANEDFDKFVLLNTQKFKADLIKYKESLNKSKSSKINDVIKGFESILNDFKSIEGVFSKKFNACKDVIENFQEKSRVIIIQWDKFKEYFENEIKILEDEYVNGIITERINQMTNEKKTNNIKIKELAETLDIKCKVVINRIKEMIEISKVSGKLYEDKKCLLVYTEDYYKNKELKNYLENTLLKDNSENIGKILALYDSSIRNRTLSINMLNLQNRINDLGNYEDVIRTQFNTKVKDLQINQERSEFLETRKSFNDNIENNKKAIADINSNLKLFNDLENFVMQEYDNLKLDLSKKFSKIFDEIDKSEEKSYIKVRETLENKQEKFEIRLKQAEEKLDSELKDKFEKSYEAKKLEPEIREFFVKKKNLSISEYNEKKIKISDQLVLLKDESYRGKLINYINNQKIRLSQLLGTIQARVEDDVEIKQFKRASLNIVNRTKDINQEIKEINKNLKNLIKDFNRESKNFETKNKYILDDFNKFLNEFYAILNEKTKSLEQFILKSYVNMAIKAVANEFLSISFLQNELNIKKQNIQDHLIYLISAGELIGKYDLRLGIYYENMDILKNLDENELQVVKKMNFRLYMLLTRLRSFSSQYGSIIALFGSILAISYYIFQFSGQNPAVISVPIITVLLILIYFFFKKKKEEKSV